MKICIVGSSGVGKTTLSKKLATIFNIPFYEFDAIYWNLLAKEYEKQSQEAITQRCNDILSMDSWIIEGAYDRRLLPFF